MTEENIAASEKQGEKRGGRVKAAGIFILIFIFLLSVGAFVADYKGYSLRDIGGCTCPGRLIYSVLPENIKDIKTYSSGIACLTANSVDYIDPSGKKRVSNSHAYSQPVIDTNGSVLLLYDKGGSTFRIEKNEKIYNTFTVNGSVTLARLGSNNNYVYVLNEDSGFQTHLFVYSYRGKKQFEWGSASDYCIDARLSPNGKGVAVAVAGVENAQYYSKLMLFSFNQKEPVFSVKLDDLTVCGISFIGKNSLCLVTEDGFYLAKPDGSLTPLLSYQKNELTHSAFCRTGAKCIALTRYGDVRNSAVNIFDKKCQKNTVRRYNTEVSRLCVCPNYAAVVLGDKIEVIDRNNNVSANICVGEEFHNAVFSGRNLYALTLRGIFKFPVNCGTDSSFCAERTTAEAVTTESQKNLG